MKQKQKHRQPGSPCSAPYVSRTGVVRADAQHRWDYLYQLLLQWSVATEPTESPKELEELADQYRHPGHLEQEAQEAQEDNHANGNRHLCSRLDQSSAPEPNAER